MGGDWLLTYFLSRFTVAQKEDLLTGIYFVCTVNQEDVLLDNFCIKCTVANGRARAELHSATGKCVRLSRLEHFVPW